MTYPKGPSHSMASDRYHAVGLVENPFVIEDAPAHFVARGLGPPPLPGSSTMVQVIGEKGFGKTTQLHEWRRSNPGPYHWVPDVPRRHRWKRAPVAPLVYADEVDRMPRPLRQLWLRRLAHANATVVVGTHVDLANAAARAGLCVVTHRLGPVSAATLRRIVEAKMERASLDPGRVERLAIDDDDLADIHRKANGSIRRAEILLHELVAERVR